MRSQPEVGFGFVLWVPEEFGALDPVVAAPWEEPEVKEGTGRPQLAVRLALTDVAACPAGFGKGPDLLRVRSLVEPSDSAGRRLARSSKMAPIA